MRKYTSMSHAYLHRNPVYTLCCQSRSQTGSVPCCIAEAPQPGFGPDQYCAPPSSPVSPAQTWEGRWHPQTAWWQQQSQAQALRTRKGKCDTLNGLCHIQHNVSGWYISELISITHLKKAKTKRCFLLSGKLDKYHKWLISTTGMYKNPYWLTLP